MAHYSQIAVALAFVANLHFVASADDKLKTRFSERIQPILEDYCIGCHGKGKKSGGLSLEDLNSNRLCDRSLWRAVLKNIRCDIMPPAGKPRPSESSRRDFEDWIKYVALGINPANADPGPTPVRRLNRVEYRNTIRDLMGVDYDTTAKFPPDDSGHGFDNIADVLTVSPLLLEKYLAAAETIVSQAVPIVPRVIAETKVPGARFVRAGAAAREENNVNGPLSLSFYESALVTHTFRARNAGRYELVLNLTAREKATRVADYNKCRLTFKVDGAEMIRAEFGRQDEKPFTLRFNVQWLTGQHELAFALEPLTPDQPQRRALAIRIDSVDVRGPSETEFWVPPPNHSRFFPNDPPQGIAARQDCARSVLRSFASNAFRHPVDEATLARLTSLAEREYSRPGRSFEAGIARAMTAALASPSFLFREEGTDETSSDQYPLVDEYALASRLSYFLWSTMPDPELFRLAGEHSLRTNLALQLKRMLADRRSQEFVRHFVGQWLQARDIGAVHINAFAVVERDQPDDAKAERNRAHWQELDRRFPGTLTVEQQKERNHARATYFKSLRRFREHELSPELRVAMRRETEMLFERVVREDRDLRELLNSDYTYLNEALAKHYGIDGVNGEEMRLVALPRNSPRGGVLTQGTVLAVTSNPDRTSPVKRGLFILDNILGMPAPPSPPGIPRLEEAAKAFTGRVPSLRETLELHRNKPSCKSCHDRMDPLGLALENFDALGLWREREQNNVIEPRGKLITGESFSSVQELKRILAEQHGRKFFRCLSEKMLIYALGRALEDSDVETVDSLVDRIERASGRASALIAGIVESAQFQRYGRTAPQEAQMRLNQMTANPIPHHEPGPQQ